jgi:hypothetical protein
MTILYTNILYFRSAAHAVQADIIYAGKQKH